MDIAGYQVEERIAVGGMAEIFRARRSGPAGFAKQVVIKRLLPDLARDQVYVDMFLEEARLAATLSCRNIVQVFDFGEENGAHFMVMEYVNGCDLATLFRVRGRLSVELTGVVGGDLCEALAYLHEATDNEIVHRDVNPANILVSTRGEVKLADLGIAKIQARALRTSNGIIKGKLAYLSPEQARGDQLDARSDIYALGLCLYEALTGEHYLQAESDAQLFRAAQEPPARPLRLSPPVDAVVNRTLEREPERRFPNARALRDALAKWPTHPRVREELGQFIDPKPSQPAVAAVPERGVVGGATSGTEVHDVLRPRRSRWWLGLGMVVILAAVVAGLLLWPAPEPVIEPAIPAAKPEVISPAPTTLEPESTPAPIRAVVKAKRPTKPEPKAEPKPEPEPEPEAPTGAQARALLGELSRVLGERGLLPGDVAELTREQARLRKTVDAGETPMSELDALVAKARAVVIDRNFVDAKLQRLTHRMEGRELAAEARNKVQRHTRRALSHSVRGEYDAANGELNRVAELVP